MIPPERNAEFVYHMERVLNLYHEPYDPDQPVVYFEFYFTPVHGSWLNMAEVEWNALGTECLDRRIPDEETLRQEITAWETNRNNRETSVDWQFTPDKARIKLKQLYFVSEKS